MYQDCKNIKYTDDYTVAPSFFAYKCDDENNVKFTTKYFANSSDSSHIYVTYIPDGCYNKNLKVPRVSFKDTYEYFSNKDNIPVISKGAEIDGKKIIRFAK